MKKIFDKKILMNYFSGAPTARDVVVLCCFAVLVTFQPFFLHGEINIFEVGLYLPGINAVLHGMIPCRDFFHLRGPFELYMPAALMSLFGVHVGVLSAYFYFGTVLCFLVCVGIAKEIYKTRLILYLMVPVFVARTFPRVVFTYWGGMRYAFGLLALFCAVKFFRRNRPLWLFLAGLFSACGLLTSVEIGVCAIASVFSAAIFSLVFRLQERKVVFSSIVMYFLGVALGALPYFVITHSLIPYLDSAHAAVAYIQDLTDPRLLSEYPSNAVEMLMAMVTPTNKNFRHMTPIYLYILLFFFLASRIKRGRQGKIDLSIACIGIYGLAVYSVSFHCIWGAQFEMALQPEKILFFFIIEHVYLFLREKKRELLTKAEWFPTKEERRIKHITAYAISILFAGVVIFSLGSSMDRYNKRFFAFKYIRDIITGKNYREILPLAKVESRPLTIERARGMVVPAQQADELEAVVNFVQKNTKPDEVVFTFPELGAYSFLADRPFLGRFPIASFSWFNDTWHRELVAELKNIKPRFIITPKKLGSGWVRLYFAHESNRKKYAEVMSIIRSDYSLRAEMPQTYIYELKN